MTNEAAFDRDDITYHVSDERLKAFKALSTLEKLRWQEDIATFIRLTRLSQATPVSENEAPSSPQPTC